jgi:uncharacterized protein
MAIDRTDRASYFPIIEKRYGEPMKYWHAVMKDLQGLKYADQVSYLKENFGFSQAHANALVMYSRGSKSPVKYGNIDQYLKDFEPKKRKLVKDIFKVFQNKYPKSEVVIAWNKPMLKIGEDYIFTVTVQKNHLMLAPWGDGAIEKFLPKLTGYVVKKKTFQVPLDWEIDQKLLLAMAAWRIKGLK